MSSSSLSISVTQAIAYLTRPLILSYSATTIVKLQFILEANLTALFAPSWVPKEPLRGSGRRCLTLSPNCLPPRAIYSACISAGVQWFDWIALLGGQEFDFFVDPGCISMRFGGKADGGKLFTIWSEEMSTAGGAAAYDEAKIQAQIKNQVDARAKAQSKSLAQQLLEDDEAEGQQLFAMIADEIDDPAWTPILDQFPVVPRSSSPLSTISNHSRSSSCSSSSGFSFSSSETVDSYSSVSSSPVSSISELSPIKQSRRERARQARVFIDTTKTEVTPYDGGKTTVLTGGVMLGAKHTPTPSTKKAARPASTSWRSSRA